LLEPFETASPDAFIQEQQKKRAQKLKRLFLVLAVLGIIAIAIAVSIALPNKQEQSTSIAEVALKSAYSSKEQEAAREAFKLALANYETDIAPTLLALSQAAWKASAVKTLETEKERALTLFANSGFVQALGILNKVEADAKALIAEWHQAFLDKLAQAQSFYSQRQIQQARLALIQAEKIKPNHPQSQGLTAQLAAFDIVEQYLAQLAVARVENNLENQVALMQQVLAADPTRQDINAPLQHALERLNEKRLVFALGRAEEALANDDISQASTYIQQAETIQPAAKGISALRTELNKRLAAQGLGGIKADIARLKAADDWPQVLQAAERGVVRFSQDAQLQQEKDQAQRVLQAQRKLESFVARPQRLSEINIREGAQNALRQSISLLPLSNTLAQHAKRLSELIGQYAAKIPVTVRSDEKTFISVIGAGVIGEVSEKVIELTPGTYVFEGKCAGYRSKRLNVSVQIGTPIAISLICDEKLKL
jgi:hypothetical protein